MSPAVTDLDLKSDQLKALQTALVAAFPNRFAFNQFAQYRLDLDLGRIVSDVGIDEVAFALIGWAKSTGRLGHVVASARAENPGNPQLRAFAEQIGVQPAIVEEAPNPTQANRGLTALHELMDAADARNAVRAFEAEFQEAVGQIDVLGVFKDVHDLLHTLQFRCFDGLARQAPRFPADDLAREIITEHGVTLEETIVRLDAVTAHRAFDDGKPRWIADLRDARAQVLAALDAGSAEPLKIAVRCIDRVLAVQPTRINTRLTDAARALRLRDLVSELSQVHAQLSAAGLDAGKLSEFETGINNLQQLGLALRQLVSDHDRWQELDVELRLAKNALHAHTEDLGSSWPRLKAQLLPLCGSEDPWAARLNGECVKLDVAVAGGDLGSQRSTFIQVHSQAATRFYQVDLSLQRLCESLREIGTPLTGLLRKLQ